MMVQLQSNEGRRISEEIIAQALLPAYLHTFFFFYILHIYLLFFLDLALCNITFFFLPLPKAFQDSDSKPIILMFWIH